MNRISGILSASLIVGAFCLTPSVWAQGSVVMPVAQQAITVDEFGRVGFNTSSPGAAFHLFSQADGDRIMAVGNSPTPSGCAVNLGYLAASWGPGWGFINVRPCPGGTPHLRFMAANQNIMEVRPDGVWVMDGEVYELPDYVFDPDYPLASIEDHASSMWTNRHLPSVGAAREDGVFEIRHMTTSMLEELEKAHIYVDQLNDRLKTEERKTAALNEHFVVGRFLDASSRHLKQNIAEVSAEQAMKTVLALSPVRFAYSEDPSEEHLGFIAEDVPDLVATADRKTLSAMDVVAVLTKTVQEQQRLLEEKDTQLQALEQRMSRLEGLLQADAGAGPSSRGTDKAAD